MSPDMVLVGLAGVLTAAAPVLFGVIGETISERAGVINLSMNGTILLTAMGGFAMALASKSVVVGFLGGMLIGGLVALVVAFASITLRQSQVAVGFVLALLCRDLSYFLGNPIMGSTGRLSILPIPFLRDLPVLGVLLFRQDIMTYLSFVLIGLAWVFIFRTRPGLMLRGIGERPAAAYVRGANVNMLRYLYTVVGGAIAGLPGPIYSLSVKAGWKGTISGLDGIGLDSPCNHDLRRLEPLPGCFWRLPFLPPAVARSCAPAGAPGGSFAGAAGCTLSPDDPYPAPRECRKRRLGGTHSRAAARSGPARRCHGPSGAERHTALRPGNTVRKGIAAAGPGRQRFLGDPCLCDSGPRVDSRKLMACLDVGDDVRHGHVGHDRVRALQDVASAAFQGAGTHSDFSATSAGDPKGRVVSTSIPP